MKNNDVRAMKNTASGGITGVSLEDARASLDVNLTGAANDIEDQENNGEENWGLRSPYALAENVVAWCFLIFLFLAFAGRYFLVNYVVSKKTCCWLI